MLPFQGVGQKWPETRKVTVAISGECTRDCAESMTQPATSIFVIWHCIYSFPNSAVQIFDVDSATTPTSLSLTTLISSGASPTPNIDNLLP
jgi:hypothetical protein